MRILLLNDTTLKAGLMARGHDVRACGPEARYLMPDQDHFDFTFASRTVVELSELLARLGDWVPELILHTEIHTNYFYRGIESAPCPTLWRTIDNHIHPWQPRYAVTHDLVLVAQRDYLADFEALHPYAWWLPLNSFSQVHYDRKLTRDLPAVFVGSLNPEMHPERAKFFAAVRQKVPVEVQSGLNQNQMSELYNRAKIVVNQCVHKDLNYRVYEAMANGAMLLTPRIQNGQPELFVDGRELVSYPLHDADEAARLIQYYLEHEDERVAIAAAGHQAVMRAHTLEHRLETILSLVQEVLPAAYANRARRFTPQALSQLIPLYAALHSQRYANAGLALDALELLATNNLMEALASITRIAIEHIDGGRMAFAEPYLMLGHNLGGRGAIEGLLGRVRMSQGRMEEANELLEAAVVSSATEPSFWFWLALCHQEKGDMPQTIAALKHCLQLQPGRTDATRLLQRLEVATQV